MRIVLALAVMAAVLPCAGQALAQGSDGCAGFKWPIARERAALTAPAPATVAAGGVYPGLGSGVAVALKPQADVHYAVAPRRAPKAEPAYGGELSFTAAQAATLQVTISDEAWVDLSQNGKVLRSTDFSGKKTCPGVRKSLRFAVSPGPVTVSISDSPAATLRLDIDVAP